MGWIGWDGELTYQTQRADVYNRYVDKLLETGHAYWCSCTAEEAEAMREEVCQNGLCRAITALPRAEHRPRVSEGHCAGQGLWRQGSF